MSCICIEKISLLVDGELPAAEARVVEHHLIDCAECREARADFLSLRQQIGAYATSLEPLRQQQALARILSQPETTPARSGRRQQPQRLRFAFGFSPAWAAAVALLLVAVLISFVLYRGLRHNAPSTPGPEVITGGTPAAAPAPSVVGPQKQNPTETQALTASSTNQQRRVNPKRNLVASLRQPAEVPVDFGQLIKPDQKDQTESTEVVVTAVPVVRSADSQTLTALHLENSEVLLRAFRNLRLSEDGSPTELSHERQRAQQLVYQNMLLRREADIAGDVQVAALLESLEPILLDIANLPADAQDDDVHAIQGRVERKNIVALLQVNSTALAKALD